MKRIPVSFVFLALLAVGVIVYALNFPKKDSAKSPISPVVASVNSPVSSQISVPSSDGTMILTMTSTRNTDGTVRYDFTSGGRTIFTRTVGPKDSMTIPPNSWSPDNKYVFVESLEGRSVHYFVMKASGLGEALDVAPLFAKSQPKLTIKDVTGWDSTDLLHVTSMNGAESLSAGRQGPNFWFVVETGAFMQLY